MENKLKLDDNELAIVNKTIEFVKKTLEGSESGHNWFHIERVMNNAKLISSKTNSEFNYLCVILGALLHDISDYKFNNGNEELGIKIAEDFLSSINVKSEIINKVKEIIDGVTFKGLKEKRKELSLECQIVQDSDRLDALGAIGIGRAFAYGGNKNREMYVPDEIPNENMDWKAYKNNNSCTLNHFYEKLFYLKDLMNTDEGKKLAEKRHDYMVEFVNKFKKEWNGEDYM